MEIYKLPIELAFVVFPFIAFILTIPFLLYQYRKYGAIPILKSFIFYSLILYLICAYFLVILPLPTFETVKTLTTPKSQLIPFHFIKELSTINVNIDGLKALLNIFGQPTIYTVLFNLILTLPYGVYLRYFYNKKWYQVIIYSFLLSLFFELTQLSGLYGIYPRPYRLFDIDDLLINTIGGGLGYLITPMFTMFLPTKSELEAKSYKKGNKVTLLRRVMAFSIDIFFLSILMLCLKIITYSLSINNFSNLISVVVYYLIIPIFFEGQTIGKRIVRIKLIGIDGNITILNNIFRYFVFSIFTIFPYTWISPLKNILDTQIISRIYVVLSIYEIANISYYILTFFKRKPLFLYEQLTNTKNISTISIDN